MNAFTKDGSRIAQDFLQSERSQRPRRIAVAIQAREGSNRGSEACESRQDQQGCDGEASCDDDLSQARGRESTEEHGQPLLCILTGKSFMSDVGEGE